MTALSENQINHLNTGLIVLSALAAWVLPLEVFLFSYAVLGPLHYFTEISWLHDRNYFGPSKWHSLPLYGLSALILILAKWLQMPIDGLVFLAFGFAVLICFVKSVRGLVIGTIILAFISQIIAEVALIDKLFSVYLPTLIHVCLFTLFFMMLSSVKSSSKSGMISVLVYCLCAMVIILFPESSGYTISNSVYETTGNFKYLAQEIIVLLERETDQNNLVMAFRFMAFAYTYHYLNWFSKTRVINWHRISRQRAWIIIALWLISIALYAYDYKTGLLVLFFFSLVHVFLEFPLNVRCMKELLAQCVIKVNKAMRGDDIKTDV